MQLDQARVAISERTWGENLDLALHVTRRDLLPITACALMGILPFALFNHVFVFGGMDDDRFLDNTSGYLFLLTMFVLIEAPLASAGVTLYLGQAMFVERASPRILFGRFLGSLPQLFLLQGVLRAILIFPVVTAWIPYVLWPYLSEVILLERNRMFSSRGEVSTLGRSAAVHRRQSGEFMGRAIFGAGMALLLVLSLVGTQDAIWNGVLGFPRRVAVTAAEVQAAMWIVVVYFAVARFLSYLDQRIKSEGWELELLLRAQRERMSQ